MGLFSQREKEVSGVDAKTEAFKGSKEEKVFTKFRGPKFLLLDIDEEINSEITRKWDQVAIGSLGGAYEVRSASTFQQVVAQTQLERGYAESEIVVIDFAAPELQGESKRTPDRPEGELDIWAKCDQGYIDNRINTILTASNDFGRIHANGGVFVIFAAPSPSIRYALGSMRPSGRFDEKDNLSGQSIWSIIPALDSLAITKDDGEEIKVCDSSPLGKLLSRYLPESRFECTFRTKQYSSSKWQPLARNKFKGMVALFELQKGFGPVIILPQLLDKSGFLTELFEDVLPDMVPELFPDVVSGRWVHQPEYELKKVLELEIEKKKIELAAQEAIAQLNLKIAAEREKNGWLQSLLFESGDPLVEAVKLALADIGFKQVVDIDKIRDAENKSRREDLQIRDDGQVVVVDIKGIGGYPSDDDVAQATKHALLVTREERNSIVTALSIINHQRNLPPLSRENVKPFRQELIDNSLETRAGLMTAYDLYKIVLNVQLHAWKPEYVIPLFYRPGRVDIVPAHYLYIGIIAKVWTEAFGVVLSANDVSVGDILAVEGKIHYFEMKITSIKVNEQEKMGATIGDKAGFVCVNQPSELREDMRVFVVKKLTPN